MILLPGPIAVYRQWKGMKTAMHLDTEAYLALAGFASVLVISLGLLVFMFMRKT